MRWRRRREDLPLTALERRSEGISAYLDDELSDAERAEIEALLAEDADARDSLGDLRLLTAALASLGEVRAPRSFAIPAPAAGASAPVGMFRRMELGIRGAAAAAALFFVVALVNQPAGMTVGAFSPEATTSADDSMAATTAMDARQTADDATSESAGLLAAPESGTATSDGGEEAPAPAPGEAPAPTDRASSERASEGAQDAAKAGPAPDAAFGAPVTGTTRDAGASDGVGGVAPALAVLAALLTALSVLVARGSGQSTGHRWAPPHRRKKGRRHP